MRILFIFIFAWLVSGLADAQKLIVQGMKATNDLSASQERRKDLNNEMCGLVKVRLAEENVTFEGNIINPVIYKDGEYWVYMTKGSKELHVMHPNFVPLEVKFNDYNIRGIQSLATYTLTLLKPTVVDGPSPIETFHVSGVPIKMVLVEGNKSKNLKSYFIGQMAVTQKLWETVMEKNPARFKGELRPVESISMNDCKTFIERLNNMTGQEFRLPTEKEWEYAARGGKLSKGYKYAGSNDINAVALYGSQAGQATTNSVASKAANELGIYDMSGNVWEWCKDGGVARGGGVGSDASQCTINSRRSLADNSTQSNVGFRLAISAKDIKPGKESAIMNYDGIPIILPNATEDDVDDIAEVYEEEMLEHCVKAACGTNIPTKEWSCFLDEDPHLIWLILISDYSDAQKMQWIKELKALGDDIRGDDAHYIPKVRDLMVKLYRELYKKLKKKAG